MGKRKMKKSNKYYTLALEGATLFLFKKSFKFGYLFNSFCVNTSKEISCLKWVNVLPVRVIKQFSIFLYKLS